MIFFERIALSKHFLLLIDFNGVYLFLSVGVLLKIIDNWFDPELFLPEKWL